MINLVAVSSVGPTRHLLRCFMNIGQTNTDWLTLNFGSASILPTVDKASDLGHGISNKLRVLKSREKKVVSIANFIDVLFEMTFFACLPF